MLSLLAEIISTSADTIKGSRLQVHWLLVLLLFFSLFTISLSLWSSSFQQLASLNLVELCKASSGRDGCATALPAEISVLLNALESPVASLRFAALQGLLVIKDLLSAEDHGTAQTAKLIRRLWVARFDVDEENAKVGERYSFP